LTYQRVALAVGAISASVVLALGLTAAGLAPVPAEAVEGQALQVDTERATAEPAMQPRKVYVKPAPKARTIVVREAVPTRSQTTSAKRSTAKSGRTTAKANPKKRQGRPRKRTSSPPTAPPTTAPREREDEGAKHECERAAERLHETDEQAAEELKKQCEKR
jgi:hypothetical protein